MIIIDLSFRRRGVYWNIEEGSYLAHSWFATTEDFATEVEIRLFSLSLISYANCAGAEDSLSDLMSKIIELSQDFNGTQAIRVPQR